MFGSSLGWLRRSATTPGMSQGVFNGAEPSQDLLLHLLLFPALLLTLAALHQLECLIGFANRPVDGRAESTLVILQRES